jgi:hypothetical protein
VTLQLGGATPGDGAGFYDQINLTNTASALTLATGTTLSISLGYTPAFADRFFIITRADSGAFGTKFSGAAEGALISIGNGYLGTITYRANWTGSHATSALTGGNDVAIYNIVPEPGSLLHLAAGVAVWGFRRSRGSAPRT